MADSPFRTITPEERETYARDGIVCLKGFIKPDWVEHLRQATEDEMADPGPMVLDLTRDGGGRFFGNTFVWHHRPAFERFVKESPAAEVAASILGSSKVNVLFDQLLVKEPGTEQPTMWHHDATYWPVAGDQVMTMWIALDHVTPDSGAVEYIKGSHRWGIRYKARSFTGDDRYKEDLPEIPDIDAEREKYDFAVFDMEPGDLTLHHGLTVHGAPGNSTQRRRRAYILRWCGDDVTYNPRPNIQPMLREPDIAAGAPLDSDLFPRIWTRAA